MYVKDIPSGLMPKTVTCPDCSNTFDSSVNVCIDAERDQSAMKALLAGELNVVPCPACGEKRFVDVPLAILTPSENHVLFYIPWEELPELNLLNAFQFNGEIERGAFVHILTRSLKDTWRSEPLPPALNKLLQLFRKGGPIPQPILVFNMAELCRNVEFQLRVFNAYMQHMRHLTEVTPPADYLRQGSRFYKKRKLAALYKLARAFRLGSIYSKVEFDDAVARNAALIRECEGQANLARGLVDVELIERVPDGTAYWRVPPLEMTKGVRFPMRLAGLSKVGYHAWEDDAGVSVHYGKSPGEWAFLFFPTPGSDADTSSRISEEFAKIKQDILAISKSDDLFFWNAVEAEELAFDINSNATARCAIFDCNASKTDAPLKTVLLLAPALGGVLRIQHTTPGCGGIQRFEAFAAAALSLLA